MSAEIKNLREAAERIKKAIENKENIVLYGDADLDGVTSVIVLKETIKNLAGFISAIYFPDREKEGYGISKQALNFLKEKAPALFIALDCGISNFEEIKIARKLGFEVIIIEHHQVIDKLPEADIIVDPKQKEDKSPYQYLATVGISYKLSQLIFSSKMKERLRKNLLELVALGTIADMMPREGDNKTMIEEGLESLKNTWRPGLEVFFEKKALQNQRNIYEKGSKIISLLNVRDIEDQLPASYRLLTAVSKEKAQEILQKLIKKNKERKRKRREIIKEIERRISKLGDPVIFEGDTSWDLILLGSVASIISQQFQKPTFLFKKHEKESHGTARTPGDEDLVAAMKSCSGLLETFGGHAKAAGFRIKNRNLDKFKECLIEYFEKK